MKAAAHYVTPIPAVKEPDGTPSISSFRRTESSISASRNTSMSITLARPEGSTRAAGVCYLFGLKDDVSAFFISFRRRSVGKLMCIRRSLSFLLFFFLLIAGLGDRATAQTLKNLDGAVSVFGQFTGTTNGNNIADNPTDSMGALATVRQSFHPWLGYEVNYSYTRFHREVLQHSFRSAEQRARGSGAYLLQGPTIPILGLQPFAAVGVEPSSSCPPPSAAKNTANRTGYRCFMSSASTIRSSPRTSGYGSSTEV